MHTVRFGVSYDFRNPPDSGVADSTLYKEILEQVQWLEGLGADLVCMLVAPSLCHVRCASSTRR